MHLKPKKTIRAAFTMAGAVVLVALTGGTAFANGTTVWTPADNVPSPYISANTNTHCLTYYANEHNGWNWGGYRVVDHDTGVQVHGGSISALSAGDSGNICGLYGQHYYIQVWGGSGTGSLSN